MTLEELDLLVIGDVVRHESGETCIVTGVNAHSAHLKFMVDYTTISEKTAPAWSVVPLPVDVQLTPEQKERDRLMALHAVEKEAESRAERIKAAADKAAADKAAADKAAADKAAADKAAEEKLAADTAAQGRNRGSQENQLQEGHTGAQNPVEGRRGTQGPGRPS